MKSPLLANTIGFALLLSLAACGGGGSGSSSGYSTATQTPPAAPTTAPVSVLVSDANSDDWSLIGVRVLGISLNPEGGGAPVSVYTPTGVAPMINLVQLDQLAEILANTPVPVGTYTSATVMLSANPGDVALIASDSPTPGFAAAPGSTIPTSAIQIQNATGSAGALAVPVNVKLATPLVVTASGSNALDLEFDLSHPAFILAHTPVGGGSTLWAVNFNGPLHHHPIASLEARILRHVYGNVTGVSADNTSITITKELPTLPVVTPETAASTGQSIAILADATNGSIFYDVDARTRSTITSFATVSNSLAGKYVRVAARYQQDGTLVATRVWASSSFNSVWLSPEGHVRSVDPTTGTMTVTDESGGLVTLNVNGSTQFFKRGLDGSADTTPIGTGPAFLSNIVTGFKVHVGVVDPLASTLTAQSVEIEVAKFSGLVSAASAAAGVTYTHDYPIASNDYAVTLPFISSTTSNGTDSSGNLIAGFKWWNFAYPTLVTSGNNAVSEFVALSTGNVDFGAPLGPIKTYALSYATWNDPAAANAWSAPWAVVEPSPLPAATVTTGLSAGSFTMTAIHGSLPVTVDISTTSGQATLAYQVDRADGTLTVSPLDLTNPTDLATLSTDLQAGSRVKVDGVPQPDGTIKAYAVTTYTGTAPGN